MHRTSRRASSGRHTATEICNEGSCHRTMSGLSYKDSGVNLDLYNESMERLPRLMHRTFSPRVRPLDGGFAGLFQLDFDNPLFRRNYRDPVLVSCTDGVGTKLKVAIQAGRHHTIGIDLVAMCVNDAICCGAEPLFFLDYVAMSHDDPDRLEQIVRGISDGCVQADCSLLGGETAIMPDVYAAGDYDLAGFCVGVVERKHLITGASIAPGDVVLGVASSGIHSNGYSLVRKIVFDRHRLDLATHLPELQETIGEALLKPTVIYAGLVKRILRHYKVKSVVHGIAHITGGGIEENIERILPPGVQVQIDCRTWERSPVFPWLQRLGDVATPEMFRVFNMGIGLTLMVSSYYADNVRRMIEEAGFQCWNIGHVVAGDTKVVMQNRD